MTTPYRQVMRWTRHPGQGLADAKQTDVRLPQHFWGNPNGPLMEQTIHRAFNPLPTLFRFAILGKSKAPGCYIGGLLLLGSGQDFDRPQPPWLNLYKFSPRAIGTIS